MRAALIAALLVASIGSAEAQFATGNTLLNDCQNTGVTGRQYCIGFVSGVVDGVRFGVPGQQTAPICIVPGVTAGQMADVVVAYLQRFAGVRHFPASILTVNALSAAFPCR